jgi:hypothetical protein
VELAVWWLAAVCFIADGVPSSMVSFCVLQQVHALHSFNANGVLRSRSVMLLHVWLWRQPAQRLLALVSHQLRTW